MLRLCWAMNTVNTLKHTFAVVPNRAEIISFEFKEKMLRKDISGEGSQGKLRHIVLFLLCTLQEHQKFWTETEISLISDTIYNFF